MVRVFLSASVSTGPPTVSRSRRGWHEKEATRDAAMRHDIFKQASTSPAGADRTNSFAFAASGLGEGGA